MDWKVKKTISVAIFLLYITSLASFAQSSVKNKEQFLEAESYFLYEEFNEALPLYIQLKENYPANYNLDYKIGRCYLYMPYEKTKAVKYLEKAAKNTSAIYKDGNFKENMAPVDALFYLADAYRVNNQLGKAIETYQLFKSKCSEQKYDFKLVDLQIAACKRAQNAGITPIDYDEANLGNIINTRFSEINPVVSQDETLIVYGAELPFYKAMFYSKKIDGIWQTPVNMIPELGVDDDCVPTSLSSDGKELYVYRTNEYKGDIFVTRLENGKWTKLKKLNGNINTKYWESHACISGDGKLLYFTSNRDGGFGGLDIYVSRRISGEEWSTAENLGSSVNSPYNEENPFIIPDGKTIYFSSFDHETFGGYDIFYSTRNPNGSWSKPLNVGYPINTTDDDLFFYPLRDGNIAYISRFDPKGSGKFDIFRMNIYTDRNPRKYQITGSVKIPQNYDKKGIYLSLYDKTKKDTVLRKYFAGTDIAFETVPGKYELHLYPEGLKQQSVPLTINYGSKETKQNIIIDLSATKTSDIVPIIIQTKDQGILASENNAFNKQSAAIDNDLNTNDVYNQSSALSNDSTTKIVADSSIYQQQAADTSVLREKETLNDINKDAKTSELYNLLQNRVIIYMGIVLIGIFLFLWFLIKKRKKNNQV